MSPEDPGWTADLAPAMRDALPALVGWGPSAQHDASDDRLAAVLDALDYGVVLVRRDLRLVYANARVTDALNGRLPSSERDLLGEAGYDVVREDGTVWPFPQRPLQAAATKGHATDRALMGLSGRGPTRWLQVTARPLPEQEGRPGLVVGTFRDVTERQAATSALAESEAHFRLLAENSTDVIQRHSAEGVLLYSSPSLRDVLGWSPESAQDRDVFLSWHPEGVEAGRARFAELVRTDTPQVMRYRLRHGDGRWVWVETSARVVQGTGDGAVREVQTSTRDVTERVEAEQRLARLALADPLTGLANRAALIQRLEDLLHGGQRVALLFLDLDRFKVINDSLGHSAGDELLRVVAVRLVGACRDGDVVARLGGDEFVVVAPGLDEQSAVVLAERVQTVLAVPVGLAGHELVVSASVGIVASSEEDDDAELLLRDADVSMYKAKARGRARAVVWTKEIGEVATARLALEAELREALSDGALRVHYQPQVDLFTGRVAGIEALVRWQHPTRGLLLPAAFLDVADETGLVVDVGRVVLEQACRQLAVWRRLPGHGELELAVNLSEQELLLPGRPDEVVSVLRAAGLPPSALTLEVLESVLLDDEGAVSARLTEYVDRGLRLALDDFGTGSSSLLHLRAVPVGVVKVDRAFVAGLGRSRRDEAIVRAVRSLTGDLGLACVAEGVEEPGQRDWLVEQGVRLAQGFLLHRPLPPDDVTALLGG